jgi:hypothetical protein
VQEPAFSWKPMVANLAGSVWWSFQSLLGPILLDWIVCPRWRCLRWNPVRKGELVNTSMFARMKEINQGMDQRTCELSGEGLRRLKVFLAATFLTTVLVLVGTREAADPEVAWLLEADCGDIGWFCITTFFKGGEFLQKRTTGAGGKNSKGEPSPCVGSGPSCCCKKTERVIRRIVCELHQENLQVVVPVLRGYHIQHRAVPATVPELS